MEPKKDELESYTLQQIYRSLNVVLFVFVPILAFQTISMCNVWFSAPLVSQCTFSDKNNSGNCGTGKINRLNWAAVKYSRERKKEMQSILAEDVSFKNDGVIKLRFLFKCVAKLQESH